MLDETCAWKRIAPLVWETACKHSIGTPRDWEPEEGNKCMCCGKPMELTNDAGSQGKESYQANS